MSKVLAMPPRDSAFQEKVRHNWLDAFLEYASYGEASPRLMWWVGVSTIAAVLQRKVWFDMGDFQWSPNFYILVVGEQGVVRKSTSIDVGIRIAKKVDGVKMGPASATWQAFIDRLQEAQVRFPLPNGEMFEMACITQAVSEFGTFFKPEDREQTDVLTDLWDGKLDTWEKATRTVASNSITNPWINLIAATTPKWVSRNMSADELGGGMMSRIIFIREDMPDKDVPYPMDVMPVTRPGMYMALLHKLRELGDLMGPFGITPEAKEWGSAWYIKERDEMRSGGLVELEAGFRGRKQCHLHKLAMVVAAAKGRYNIELEDMLESAKKLEEVEGDARRVLGCIGHTKITGAAASIVATVERMKQINRKKLYKDFFFSTLQWNEFIEALRSAIRAGLVIESGSDLDPIVKYRE